MKNTIKTLAFTVLVLTSIAAKAQQQPNFLFFEQNMSLFNPAYTGSEGSLAGLQYRSAWSGIEDAPRAASFIYHTKEKNKASWGVSYLTDRVYVENQGIVAVDYSYKLTLGANTNLYLGIKAGVVYNNLDAAGLDRITQESNTNLNSIQNYMNPLVGIGLLLKGEKYFIGLSTPNMLNSKRYKASAGKSPNKNSIIGSQGFEAKMRSVLLLNKDNNDHSLRHLCIVKNNYIEESLKSESFVLKFNDQLSFENTGNRVKFGELASDEWIPHAIKMKNEGKSYRQISDELSNDGFEVSKSSLQRKIG